MTRRSPVHLGPLVVAVAAELCALGLLAVSGWYLAACALAGLGLLATFSYPTPSGIIRLLALGRIGAGYGQSLLLHRAALAETTRQRLRLYDEQAATGWDPVDDRTIDRLLTDAHEDGERVLRVTAPIVVTASAILTALIVTLVISPPVAVPLAVGSAVIVVLALLPASSDEGHGALRAEVLASMDAAPELESLGASVLLRARVLAQLDDLAVAERRRETERTRRRVVSALTAGLAFGAVVLVAAVGAGSGGGWAGGSRVEAVPLFVMIVCLAFGVLERLVALGDIVPHLQRLRGRARRGERRGPVRVASASVEVADNGDIAIVGGGAKKRPDTLRSAPPGPDLLVPVGSTTAIIGPSGAGKSTLLADIARALRGRPAPGTGGRVACVTDDEFLFTGTVASNLRLGVPVGAASLSDEDITVVVSELGLDPDILPDTRTGTGGRALSRGETRRLVVARAVLSEPDVLLVDEPDLGLDAEAAARLLGFIRTRLPAATVILAAHRAPSDAEAILDLGSAEAAAGPDRGDPAGFRAHGSGQGHRRREIR